MSESHSPPGKPVEQHRPSDVPASDATLDDEPRTSQQTPTSPPAELPRTRTSAAFKGLLAGAIVLILLLVFILENTARTRITYFGASGHMPLGVALLLAAIAGALLIGVVGTARILQLRRRIRRQHAKADGGP